VITKRPVFIRS